MADKVAVVLIHNREKRYSYFTGGLDVQKGDVVIVPVEVGGPLHATILFLSSAKRYTSKATKTILSKE